MDILCLTGLFPDEYRKEIEKDSKFGMQNAANKLQWEIVRGLDGIDGVDTKIVNSLYIGAYPKRYRRMRIPAFRFSHREGARDINVGFCNLPFIKIFSRYRGIKKEVKKWATDGGLADKTLLIYALTTPFVNIAKYVKKKYPKIKVCIVVPDLPDYMNVAAMERKGLYYYAKRAEIKAIKRCIRRVDCYVLLTDAMKEWFDTPITYTVVEGIAAAAQDNGEASERKKQILYAGGIKAEYGVIDMARAFIKADIKDWELIIYGDGSDMELLRSVAEGHPSVVIKGLVSNQEVLKAQREASLLINPRKNQVFTKYSFPSKILEYMSSGTPVLAYKLDGIPTEYSPFYFQIDEREDGMERAFASLAARSETELTEMGEKARKFVGECKNGKVQCQRIVDILKK